MQVRIPFALSVVIALAPQPALADELLDAAGLGALERKVARQPWYPDGYYDLRVAGEGEAAEFPRAILEMVRKSADGTPGRYNLAACGDDEIGLGSGDELLVRYGEVATDVSRMRSELERLGYPPEVYREALDNFERQSLERAGKLERNLVRQRAGLSPLEPSETGDGTTGSSALPSDRELVQALAGAIEIRRKDLAPDLPQVESGGLFCLGTGLALVTMGSIASPLKGAYKPVAAASPARPVGTIVRTEPVGGAVMMVDAFSFNVCTRKVPDPWGRFACRWNEIETGKPQSLVGRYIYQVVWPDGAVRKGARRIEPGTGANAATVTLRKDGS